MQGISLESGRALWRRASVIVGCLLLSVGFGIVLGYWAADREVRWYPSMALSVLLFSSAGFGLVALGVRPLRLPFASLATLSLGATVYVLLGVKSSPLTAMSGAEFRRVHETDAHYFRDLDRTLQGLVARLETRREVFDTARVLSPEEEALVVDVWSGFLDSALALDHLRRFHEGFHRFDLSRMERERHVRSFLLSFAAELSLYENAARLQDLLDRNQNVTRFLNDGHPERSILPDSVARLREELTGLTDLGRVAAGRRYLEFLERVHRARGEAAASGYEWLWADVERYLTAVERRRRHERLAASVSSDFAPLLRGLKRVTFPVQKEVAEWMGDARLKRPGEYLITIEQADTMREALRPGDVLLSRKNWYLSNIGLPGFWPHAILYVGSNEEVASDLDGDADVREWVRSRSGRDLTFSEYLAERYPLAWRQRGLSSSRSAFLSVIEAVSEGVIQNSLHQAVGDSVVALRPRLPKSGKARAIDRAFSFLELPYDFDFDFATDHALVCTEVVWRCYRSEGRWPGLDLPTVSVAGRLTLPANEIARLFKRELGTDRAQFDFVYFIDAREKERTAVVSDVRAFLQTPDRSKWRHGAL